MENQTIDINIEIKELPVEVNTILDTLRALRGIQKWKIVREALCEYAENHKGDILMRMTSGKKGGVKR